MLSIVRITALSLLISNYGSLALASHKIELVEQERAQSKNPSLLSLQADVENFIPTGSVISFAGEKAPQGWLLCDGQQYSNQKYPQLYSVIGERYISQDSWIHQANKHAQLEKFFCVPDMRGRTAVSVDNGANRVTANNTLGASGGKEKHLLTITEMPSHNHALSQKIILTSGVTAAHPFILHSSTGIEGKVMSTESEGKGQPHNIMQPYMVLNYIIKTGQEEFDSQYKKTAQRDIELDNQRGEIAQLKQELNNLKMASAEAWVIFNGTDTKILGSYNIASVVRKDLGYYTINFSKPFNSEYYCFSLNAGDGGGNCPHAFGPYASQPTKTSFTFMTMNFPGKQFNAPFVSACFYGDQ